MLFKLIKALLVCSYVFSAFTQAETLDYYFDTQTEYRSDIPTPKSILGFEVGDRHVRHDQLIQYFQALAAKSDNVVLQDIGYTNEHRRQVIATISSKDNLENLDDILSDRRATNSQDSDAPVVVWLGYSIHGNEISGSNASILVAYQLAAATSSEVDALLENIVIVIEPSMNPDGMDRFTTYANGNRNKTDNSDPNHREHQLQWPSGRTNHYMFDLNRDWLPITQTESRNRITQFHYYKPNVMADFHEMGKDGNYFFQPGVPTRDNPLTPDKTIELTRLFATYHGKALDNQNRLYYSQEAFDDFYYGKGSTYPDINGAVGILFEQASTRGYLSDSRNGVMSFGFSIKNHVLTSFSTLTAALENKTALHNHRSDFYNDIDQLADAEGYTGYLITEQFDQTRLHAFLELLNRHEIRSYPITKSYQGDSHFYDTDNSYFIPLKQNQYRVIKTIFEHVTTFKDNTFYDVSGWTLPLAYNLKSTQVETSRGLSISTSPWQPNEPTQKSLAKNAYAYAFAWQDYLAPKLLNKLLSQGINARVATQPFSAVVNGGSKEFSAGSIVIPQGVQDNPKWFEILNAEQANTAIAITAISSGMSQTGINLGSPSLSPLTPIKVMMIGGHPIFENEAGHMLYYLDETLEIPVSVIDTFRFMQTDISSYTHIVMVDGEYKTMPEGSARRLKQWIEAGGVVYAQKGGAKYLAAKNLLNVSFIKKNEIDRLFNTANLSYADKDGLAAKKRIAGTIFSANLDLSHPITYGYQSEMLPLFKNSTNIIEQPSKPFLTVARYQNSPLLSGYAAPEMIDKVSGNAAIVAQDLGLGRIVASTNNLVFRGYWLGTSKIVANALFFSSSYQSGVKTD